TRQPHFRNKNAGQTIRTHERLLRCLLFLSRLGYGIHKRITPSIRLVPEAGGNGQWLQFIVLLVLSRRVRCCGFAADVPGFWLTASAGVPGFWPAAAAGVPGFWPATSAGVPGFWFAAAGGGSGLCCCRWIGKAHM